MCNVFQVNAPVVFEGMLCDDSENEPTDYDVVFYFTTLADSLVQEERVPNGAVVCFESLNRFSFEVQK